MKRPKHSSGSQRERRFLFVSSLAALRVLERGARILRRCGLSRLVDGIGPALGGRIAQIEITVNDVRLVGNHAGHLYYLRELAEEQREAYLADLLRQLAQPGGHAVDGGAHIGFLTIVLARAVGPSGTVWAFEPNPEVQTTLRKNLHLNGVAERVHIVEKALGATTNEMRFHIGGAGDVSSLWRSADTRRVVTVDVARLDDELPVDVTPDIIKLDLEGGEVAALRGMRELLGRADITAIVTEANEEALQTAGSSSAELYAELRRHGYRGWIINEKRRRLDPWRGETPDGVVNAIFARGDRIELLH